MREVYLSIGSNIDPAKHIPAAVTLLKNTFPGILVSSAYETDPVGPAGPQKFWNLAAALQTDEKPEVLVQKFREIEKQLGRVRSENKYAPRSLDIDVLPQEGYEEQAFIMIPLAEIRPEAKEMKSGKSFRELAEGLKDKAKNFRKI
jgi:2-amino-4-hydroxy-6-hydroxymethyldihydropteridine diphosphokinase